jgi:hypothetical protein
MMPATVPATSQPAASPKALTRIGREVRHWALHHRSDKSLKELAAIYYYGNFYRTRLHPTLKRIDLHVIRWARRNSSGLSIRPREHGTGSTGCAGQIKTLCPAWLAFNSATKS